MAYLADATLDPVHILVVGVGIVGTAVSAVIGFLVKRALSGFDKRQDEAEERIDDVKSELKRDSTEDWRRHDAEHTRNQSENEDEHRRIRGDIASNSEDIARLLERTKDR
jgi:uncharacterized membrane-anchored protein YhcB (DUF1043 family)